MTMKFIIRGQVTDSPELLMEKAKKVKREPPSQTHHGFKVVGYPPGYIKDQQEANAKRLAQWKTHTRDMRDKALAAGQKEPKPWDLEAWLKKNSKKRERVAKPFETTEAAEIAKAMVEKEGWEYVEVIPVIRGKPSAEQFQAGIT